MLYKVEVMKGNRMDPFNLIYLKYFIDAAEANNVSEAARKNFVTQSCVSQGIKKLEQTLKIDLTMHLKNRFKLTEEGKIVFARSKQVFECLNSILDEVSQFNKVIKGTVTVGITQSLALTFFPKIFKNTAFKYPQVELKSRIGTIDQIHQWVKSDEVDFALVLDQPEFARYERHDLAQGNFNLYKHKALKKWEKVYIDFISGMAVSSLDCGNETFELGSWELVAEFVDFKLGAGVLPDFMTTRYQNLISIQEMNLSYNICGLYRKGTALTKAANAIMMDCF